MPCNITAARLGLAMCLAFTASAMAQDAPPPKYSESLPLTATQGLILDMAESASRAIAVGERGTILVSESRADWRQIDRVPTRATLTAVSAAGDHVWAVGHDGTILASGDGGLTWEVQRIDELRPASDDEPFDPRQGVPLLDVLALDAEHAFAIGAYSQLLRTDDGGKTWTFVAMSSHADQDAAHESDLADELDTEDEGMAFSDEDLALDEESEPHFNAITRTGSGALLIAGERGAAFRSTDGGVTWERLQLPYAGSMFGALGYAGDHVVVFGMRGNVFESRDLGNTWNSIDTGTELSLMGGAPIGAGGFALAGVNGVVLTRANASSSVQVKTYANAAQETPVLSGVLARPDGSLLVAGEKGVGRFDPAAKAASKE